MAEFKKWLVINTASQEVRVLASSPALKPTECAFVAVEGLVCVVCRTQRAAQLERLLNAGNKFDWPGGLDDVLEAGANFCGRAEDGRAARSGHRPVSRDPELCSAELVLVARNSRRRVVVPCGLEPHANGRHRSWTAWLTIEWADPAEPGELRKRIVTFPLD